LPLAGIRGYAFAVDNSPNGFPCAGPDRCGDAETTLRGGIDADTATLAELPEGSSYLHAVAVSGSGMRSTSTAHAVLHVDKTDPVTTLSGAPSGWTNQAVLLNARAVDAGSGMTRIGNGPQPYTAIRIDGGAAAIGLGEAVTANVIAEGAHPVEYFARDAAGNVNDGSGQNGIANHSPRSAWVRIDRAPPTVAFANSQDPHDPDLVRVRVSDPLSGPDLTRGQIGVRVAGSGDRFEPLAPEPPGEGELRARWDSDAHSKIEYEFRAIGYDAAGNRAVATRRRDGTAMILANPLKATTALGSSFRHGRMRRTVRYGRRLLVHGRLTTGLDTPLANAPVRILERFAAEIALHVGTPAAECKGYVLALNPAPANQSRPRNSLSMKSRLRSMFGSTKPSLARRAIARATGLTKNGIGAFSMRLKISMSSSGGMAEPSAKCIQ